MGAVLVLGGLAVSIGFSVGLVCWESFFVVEGVDFKGDLVVSLVVTFVVNLVVGFCVVVSDLTVNY